MIAPRCNVNKLTHGGRDGGGRRDATRACDTGDCRDTIDASDEVVDPLNDEKGHYQVIPRSGLNRIVFMISS